MAFRLRNPFAQRLYLRIWLAVVGGMVALTLVVGWAWRLAAEQNVQSLQSLQPPAREIVLTDSNGNELLRGMATRQPSPPDAPRGGSTFVIESEDGRSFDLKMSPRSDRPEMMEKLKRMERSGPPMPGGFWGAWLRPPFGFLWLLGIVGVAAAVGIFPIIRRLLKRLENLQRGVKRFGEGDLSVRVPAAGHDEVADLARQFNSAAERIETLVTSHKSLLANASHELRSPLTRIRMGLELMGGQQTSASFKSEILRNIAELDQLVDEILLASRLDARAADVGTPETVDLIGLSAEECVRVEADLDVRVDSLEVQGIFKLLRRAVRNLLENARRYSEGEITLTLQRNGNWAEVRVSDFGPGVPPDQRERIFEPFYRLPGASERAGGVGLGLALVRSIAERHNGSVYCEDRPGGGGACFVLRLPLN